MIYIANEMNSARYQEYELGYKFIQDPFLLIKLITDAILVLGLNKLLIYIYIHLK